ncbi:hypothetical protein [Allokutzneria albata]|uniref:hypothetical protein n=1 Tax=Allokutzneria albata TaxID=211114 RepID=UPI0018D2BB73|nr:hypothetical protein [Allokutzneria albata]
MDPPQHTRIRRAATKAFTVRRVQALRPRVVEFAESLADKLISPSGLVAEYVTSIPSVALAALIARMITPENARQTTDTIACCRS